MLDRARLKPSLSIFITAYNEADILPQTLAHTLEALQGVISDYEIVIVNDASRDETGKIADKLVRLNPKIRVIHNVRNLNQGRCYQKSIMLAKKEYHCLLPGDDMLRVDSLKELFNSVGKADMSLIAINNQEIRHPIRRFISRFFMKILRFVSGERLSYFNGPAIIKTSLLKNIETSNTFMFLADSVIKLLLRGASYVVVPVHFNLDEKRANLRAVRRNFFPVLKNVFSLFWELRLKPLLSKKNV